MCGFFVFNNKVNKFLQSDTYGTTVISARFERSTDYYQSKKYYFDNASFILNGMEYQNERVCVISSEVLDFRLGDIVTFSGDIYSSALIQNNKVNWYNFYNNCRFNCSSDFIGITKSQSSVSFFERAKLFLMDEIDASLSKDAAGVAKAMMFGDKTELSGDVASAMRFAGVAHIFAVSGLHVGFISGAVLYIMKKLRVGKGPATVAAIAASFFYCGMCDFSSSALKAFIMFAVFRMFSVCGWKSDSLNTIFLSAAIILLVQPQQIVSIGFLLSYSAVIFICILGPPIKRGFAFLPNEFASNISTVISAQIGTLPLTLIAFGYTAPISLLVNFALIPLVSVFFVVLFVAILFSAVLGFGRYIMFIPDKVLSFFTEQITSINFGAATVNVYFNAVLAVLYYIGVIAVSDVVNMKFGIKLFVFMLMFSIVIIFSQLFNFGIIKC